MKIPRILLFTAASLLAAVQGAFAQYVFTDADQIQCAYVLYAGRSAVTGPLVYGGEAKSPDVAWKDKVVLVDRSSDGTPYLVKLNNVKAAGGLALILANNVSGAFNPSIGVSNVTTFPAVHVTLADGQKLRLAVGQVVSIGLTRMPPPPATVNPGLKAVTIKTASHTVGVVDVNTLVAMDSATPVDWIIPNEVNAAFPNNAQIFGAMVGEGAVTVKGETNVVLISLNNGKRAMYKGARWEATRLGPNKWLISGALEGDGTVHINQRVVLSAEVGGGGPFPTAPVFTWTKDGTVVGNNQSLYFDAFKPEHQGTYVVKVNDLTSQPVTMTIVP